MWGQDKRREYPASKFPPKNHLGISQVSFDTFRDLLQQAGTDDVPVPPGVTYSGPVPRIFLFPVHEHQRTAAFFKEHFVLNDVRDRPVAKYHLALLRCGMMCRGPCIPNCIPLEYTRYHATLHPAVD